MVFCSAPFAGRHLQYWWCYCFLVMFPFCFMLINRKLPSILCSSYTSILLYIAKGYNDSKGGTDDKRDLLLHIDWHGIVLTDIVVEGSSFSL